MNAHIVSVESLSQAGRRVVRRAPLAVRTLELLAVLALYIGGMVFIGQMTGKGHLLVVMYAIFGMPMVLSVGLRWLRTVERRLGLDSHNLPRIG